MIILILLSLITGCIWAGVLWYGIEHYSKALGLGVFATFANAIFVFAWLAQINPFDLGDSVIRYTWLVALVVSFIVFIFSKPMTYLTFVCLLFDLSMLPVFLLIQLTGMNGFYAFLIFCCFVGAFVVGWKKRAHAKYWIIGGFGGSMVVWNVVFILTVIMTKMFGTDMSTFVINHNVLVGFLPLIVIVGGATAGIKWVYARENSRKISGVEAQT